MDEFLLGLSLIVVLSVLARLVATLVQVPAIVPLLIVGVLAGTSVTGLIDPAKLLGDSLTPAVEIAVGVILFEGALNLRREELRAGVRPAVVRLITAGVVITWALGAFAVAMLFDVPQPIAVLIGAILIVSGPTVVMPILEFVSPPSHVRSVLKWEGVLIDPIGAIIAVVVFGGLSNEHGRAAFDLVEIAVSMGSGVLAGAAGALVLMPILGSRKLAARDKVAATLMLVVASFALADTLFANSGLVATIVMGVVLANQRTVKTDYIAEFKETLVPILIGILFVLLAANVSIDSVVDLGWRGLVLVAILVVLVRPLAVATTFGLPFNRNERTFFAGMAPRGIVAASTASAFGLALTRQGVKGAELIIPITFLVIAVTVFIYALGSLPLARALGLAGEHRPSLIFIGAPDWAIAAGVALRDLGAEVRFWTEDVDESQAVEDVGLVSFGGPLDPNTGEARAVLDDLSTVALVSVDDTLNQVLSFQFTEVFEPDQVYRLRSSTDAAPIMKSSATPLFAGPSDLTEIERRLEAGQKMRAFDPGVELPEGAFPIASIRVRQGASPASIHLASSVTDHLIGPRASVVALGS